MDGDGKGYLVYLLTFTIFLPLKNNHACRQLYTSPMGWAVGFAWHGRKVCPQSYFKCFFLKHKVKDIFVYVKHHQTCEA